MREFFGAIKDFLGSPVHVSNLLALLLVVSLLGLLLYTIYARQALTSSIIGFSSAIIGTITGLYFNKEFLDSAQRGERAEVSLSGNYFRDYEDLVEEHARLTTSHNEVLQLLQDVTDALPDNTEL